ncbi:MAG: hypothetical protein A4E29_00696 [Methanomassiliicoccales archaeon PtaB.Bin134]|nr:MAG: hypothetical protein A4E29_00696 [Methanomassiliicoccales archaeon PtaB.Bin134]
MRGGRRLCKAAAGLALLLLLASLPLPGADAASGAVDLVLGGQGSVAWSAGSMMPGDTGTTTIEIRNAGSMTANLMIWISNVQETDLRGDGAALSKYLRFHLSANGLHTSLSLPSLLGDLPDHPTDENQLLIGPLSAGESVTAIWSWEFVDTGAPQNDAQGDGLSFNINYLLVDIPVGGSTYNFVIVDILGKETVVGTDINGKTLETVIATDRTGRFSLHLPEGTSITTADGMVPSRISLNTANASSLPSGPPGAETVAVYNLSGYLRNGTLVRANISPMSEIVVGLDASALPRGSTIMGLYQLDSGSWGRLSPISETTVTWEVRSYVGNTGALAVFAASGSTLARLAVQDFQVKMEVNEMWWPLVLMTNRGGSITVSITIVNEGNSSGSYDLTMILDGEQVASERVALEPGESKNITFRATNLGDGTHEVTVGGETQSFVTGTTVEWPSLIAIIVAIIAGVLLLTRKRKPKKEIPEILKADYKKRVIRELGEMNLSYPELSSLTNIEDVHLQKVLEELLEEGKVVHFRERGTEMWSLAGRR